MTIHIGKFDEDPPDGALLGGFMLVLPREDGRCFTVDPSIVDDPDAMKKLMALEKELRGATGCTEAMSDLVRELLAAHPDEIREL